MIARKLAVMAASFVVMTGCADTAQAPHAGQMTPQGQSMERMFANIQQIQGFVYGTRPRSDAVAAANELVSWSSQLPTLFPPDQTAALYVDLTQDTAKQAPIAMLREAQLLLTATQTESPGAVGAQLSRTERNGCGVCHDHVYR